MSVVLILDDGGLHALMDQFATLVDEKLSARIMQMSDDLGAQLGQAIGDLRAAVGNAVTDIKGQADKLAKLANAGGAVNSAIVLDSVTQLHAMTDALKAAVAPPATTDTGAATVSGADTGAASVSGASGSASGSGASGTDTTSGATTGSA